MLARANRARIKRYGQKALALYLALRQRCSAFGIGRQAKSFEPSTGLLAAKMAMMLIITSNRQLHEIVSIACIPSTEV
jgi:hypothetical protein